MNISLRMTLTMVACVTFAAVSACALETIYVAMPENGGDDGNAGDADSPVATLAMALAKVTDDTKTILFDDGTYFTGTAGTTVDKAVELRSVNGPDVTFFDTGLTAKGKRMHFTINAAATLSGFTLIHGSSTGWSVASLDASNGAVITNCVFTKIWAINNAPAVRITWPARLVDCEVTGGGYTVAGGGIESFVELLGGEIADPTTFVAEGVKIHDITVTTTTGFGAFSIAGAGANGWASAHRKSMRNCAVWNVSVEGTASSCGAALMSKNGNNGAMGGGVVENCTFVNNRTSGYYADLYKANGYQVELRNCIFYNNVGAADGDGSRSNNGAYIHDGGKICFANTNLFAALASSGIGAGNFAADPKIVDGYKLSSASTYLIDKGALLGWMTDDSRDVDGEIRVYGVAPDIGASEYVPSSAAIKIESAGLADNNVWQDEPANFTVSVGGTDLDGLTYDWSSSAGGLVALSLGETSILKFAIPGTQIVTLTVSNAKGESDTVDFEIMVFPNTCYVDVNGGDIAPYASLSDAARTVEAALAYQPRRLLIADGDYLVPQGDEGLSVTTAMEIKSLGGREKTSLYTTKETLGCVVTLNNEEAVLCGFTVSNGISNVSGTPSCVYVKSGMIGNCDIVSSRKMEQAPVVRIGAMGIVSNCYINPYYTGSFQNNSGYRCGVKVDDGGLILNSVIDHFVNEKDYGYSTYFDYSHTGLALDGQNATARNCLVMNCTNGVINGKSDIAGGGVAIGRKGGLLENCTIVDCQVAGTNSLGGGVAIFDSSTATIRNTIVWDTSRNVDSVITEDGVRAVSGDMRECVMNSLAPEFAVAGYDEHGCTGAEPRFARADAERYISEMAQVIGARAAKAISGKWHLRNSSPCYNRGTKDGVAWAKRTSDMDGKKRIHNNRIDMGCFESQLRSMATLLMMQ